LGEERRFRMVDITEKKEVYREAVAAGRIRLKPETASLIAEGKVEKGDPLAAAEVAAALAVKKTSEIIPFCHPIPITSIDVRGRLDGSTVKVEAHVKTTARTGVEMEALVAAATYLLTVWDMVKKYEKDEFGQYPETRIEEICVKSKLKASENE